MAYAVMNALAQQVMIIVPSKTQAIALCNFMSESQVGLCVEEIDVEWRFLGSEEYTWNKMGN